MTSRGSAQALPTAAGIAAAAARLAPHRSMAPLLASETLSRSLGADVMLKVETLSPIASFKWRGALNALLVAQAGAPITAAVTSSTGNHGQGVAYAARLLGLPSEIFVPDGVEPVKAAKIRMFGARLHVGGADIDRAKDRARDHAARTGAVFVDDGESLDVMEGAGTIGRELAADVQDLDTVFVPMGSGSLAAGVAMGVKAGQPRAKVVAVQSESSPAMARSWRARRPLEHPVASLADCLECRVPADLALQGLLATVDDAVLVSDDLLLAAMHSLLTTGQILVEPGAAAGLAAAWTSRATLQGKRIAILLTGANVGAAMIGRALAAPPLLPLPH